MLHPMSLRPTACSAKPRRVEESSSGFKWRVRQGQLRHPEDSHLHPLALRWRCGARASVRRTAHRPGVLPGGAVQVSPALPARDDIEKQAALAARPQGSAFSGVQPRLTLEARPKSASREYALG